MVVNELLNEMKNELEFFNKKVNIKIPPFDQRIKEIISLV